MKIGYFSVDREHFIGAVLDDRVMNITAVPWRGDHPFLQDITTLIKTGNFRPDLFCEIYEHGRSREELWHRLEEVTFLPLIRPGKIICLGLNYVEHAHEAGRERPEEPIYFEKAVSAIIASGDTIICPDKIGRVDPEPELAVVIGREAKGVDAAEAGSCVAGYTILNDVTARDMQRNDVGKRLPWYRSKSLDTFCPLGPWIVTADEIGLHEPLHIELRVNGERRQEGSTGDLIFDIPSLIARISSLITLEAGDVISTGTPEGIAPIYPGDLVEVEIERIGILRNPVVGAPSGNR